MVPLFLLQDETLDVQTQLYIVAGTLGGIIFLVLVLLLALTVAFAK